MKKEDAIKYLQQLYPYGGHCWLDKQRTEAIGMAIQALQEKPVSEDLEEVAHKYADGENPTCPCEECLIKTFKAGAKWQKEKMIANTADAVIGLPYENKDGGYTHLVDVSRPLPVGENKITIIFKEK